VDHDGSRPTLAPIENRSQAMRAIGALVARFRHRIRVKRLNRKAGIQIASSSYIAKSARIQTHFDGRSFGGRVLISEGVCVSDGVIITPYGGMIEIHPNAYIGPYCILYGHGGLSIGRNTMIGPHTVIVPANHGFGSVDVPMNVQHLTQKGISIGDDVWIGSGCTVLDGVRIGKGAVIGAGSVVSKDIDPYAIAYGIPAAVARSRRGEMHDAPAWGDR
jgi:acetyltransferase-like isoleucine patch superfamily enzyme